MHEKLNIGPSTEISKKLHQKRISENQREDL